MIRVAVATATVIVAGLLSQGSAVPNPCDAARYDHYAYEVCVQNAQPWQGLTKDELFNPYRMSWA